MKNNKILVLGYFGYRTNQLDGQTIKTRDLYRLVNEKFENTHFFDTQDFRYSKLSVFKMFWKIICCRKLVYLPAHNNLKFIFPIIYVLSVIFRVEIYYFVVGGWLCEFIESLSIHRWMLKRIQGIYSETNLLKESLERKYRFKNVDVFTNFRFVEFNPQRCHNKGQLSLVFMARINKNKGLDWIFDLGNSLLKNGMECDVSIDFYGPIFGDDKLYFEQNIKKFPFMKYKGVLQPQNIYSVLEKYDVMLLPTHYYTEGLPGSVVDAYFSGIPVIVTEWKHAHEFVIDGQSGYIIPFKNGEDKLYEKVVFLLNNEEELSKLKDGAREKAVDFLPPYEKIQRILNF